MAEREVACGGGVMERWLPVVGFEGRYEVSDQGNIRSLSTYQSSRYHRQVAGSVNGRGYRYVTLFDGHAKHNVAVHRTVLEAFIGPCPSGHQGAHGNGDRTDNRLSNLRWASAKENIADRTAHGRTVRGVDQESAKLDDGTVRTIKRMREAGFSAYETARLACVNPTTIKRIWDGELWKHVA